MIYFSRNPIWHQGSASEANVEVVLELMIESEHLANDHTVAIRMQVKSDADGFFAFRLDPQLNAHLKVDLPDLTEENPVVCKKAIRKFYVRLAEIDPATGALSAFVDQPSHTVVLGGLPTETFQESPLLTASGPANRQFLTWCPDGKVISPLSPEYLTALLISVDQPQVAIHWDWKIGSVDYQQILRFDVTPNEPQLIRIKVLKGIPTGATSLALHIEIGGWGDGVPEPEYDEKQLTETRSYTINQAAVPARHFLFVNSLGALDTLSCTGKRVSLIDGKEEIAERSPGILGYDLTAGQSYSWNTDASRLIRQSTGYLSAADRQWLQEFVISKGGRWEVINGKLRPILLKKRGFAFQNDDKDPAGLTFEFESAFSFNAYAPY